MKFTQISFSPFIKKNALLFLAMLSFTFGATNCIANENVTNITIEEQRIDKAQLAMPEVFERLDRRYQLFAQQINKARNFTALTQLMIRHGTGLWRDATKAFSQDEQFDDRSLYWTRLAMTKALRAAKSFKQLLPMQQEQLLWQFELLSRGQEDIRFNKGTSKKILLTGFDPFFLDRNIDQSNPSGATAIALDDIALSLDGQSAEIETLILPVRFADFDQGMVEELLTPYLNKVDMIVTVSMGREQFDLERFPALRRSAKAPDNLNVFTGANNKMPLVPKLHSKPLSDKEFVEFSLPVAAMQKAVGEFKINDNRNVETTNGKVAAQSLSELKRQTSVSGSGGGYLSNEISYRSILLRDQYNPVLPVGHIHTPRTSAFQPKTTEKIIKQIKQMLSHAISAI